MSFAADLEKHVARLGIARVCGVLEIKRRTLEQWRAGREPRMVIRRGALEILAETRADAHRNTAENNSKNTKQVLT